MGNWRTVNIEGTFDPAEVAAARAHLTIKDRDWSGFGPLSITTAEAYGSPMVRRSGSPYGLNDWIAPEVDAAGNLAERDYDIDDVTVALWGLVAAAPSTRLKVHCGGDWESLRCVATITVAAGRVVIGPPEIPTLRALSEVEVAARLSRARVGVAGSDNVV